MSEKQQRQKWLKRLVRAIHRHDQCQALADDLEATGHPKADKIRTLQRVYGLFAHIYRERIEHYIEKKSFEG